MPVINGVYTKDFPALGRAPIDTDIIPIAELANQITYKTTLGELFNAKVFGTTGRLSKFTSANTLGNSILNEIGNAIHLTNAGSSYASFGIINPGTPGDPGIDNDAYIGSTINNDFTIRVNNTEAARFDTLLRFKIANIENAITDTDKFLVSDGGVVKYRTGAEVLSDIGAASASGYVPYSGATSNVNLGAFNITASSLIKAGGVDTQFLKADGSVDNNNYLTANDLPSTLSLYATNVAAAVAGYFKLVTTIDDPDYNTIAVDVPTGAITTTDQLIASLVSPVNLINGNPGVFNVTTTGNITRISGSGEAEFYFKIYKRDSGGVETLIGTSSNTIPVINTGYSEFFATAIWNDGIFGVTDSIVLKYYATRLSGGSNPTYQFQFGGDQPVRTIVPIPTAVIPNIFLEELADVEDGVASNNDGIFFDSSVSLWKYKSVSEVLGYTPANDASVVHLDGTETITGRKTFNNVNGLTIDEVSGALVPTKIFSSNIQTLNYAVSNTSNNFLGTFLGTVTANRTYSIPDISGTLALTSQLHDAITLSAIGSTPNANGATLTGQVLNLQPASASFGGVITTGRQTIAGTKTFSVDAIINGLTIGHGGSNLGSNTVVGFEALFSNTTGENNTGNGIQSLFSNTTGIQNSAFGASSLLYNTTGDLNSSFGSVSLRDNTSGSSNSSFGAFSLLSNTTGYGNIAMGYYAGAFTNSSASNLTSNNSVYLGNDTSSSASGNTNEIVIGAYARGGGSNSATLGNTSITKTLLYGNLGLGVTPSAWESAYRAFQWSTLGSIYQGNSANIGFGNNMYVNSAGNNIYITSNYATLSDQYNGQHRWFTAPSGTAGNAISFTQAMTLTSTSNLLIGKTNDEGYKLDVNGTGRFSGAAGVQMSRLKLVESTYSTNYTIYTGVDNSNSIGIYNETSGVYNLKIASTGAATFSSSVTVNGAYNVPSTSYFKGNASFGFRFNNAADTTNLLVIADSGAATLSNLAGTGSRAVLADANGLLSAPVSDISVKENIQSIGYGLNEIVKMNPVWFDFVDDYKNFGKGRQNGNIAQEMQKIIPEAVFTTPSTGKMGINYDQLHAVYIKAIQELKAEIELLKNK